MRRKISAYSQDHYHQLRQYCVIHNLHIYGENKEWLMITAEVPDDQVEPLRALDAAVNDG